MDCGLVLHKKNKGNGLKMDEKLRALQFYRLVKDALNTEGVLRVIVSLEDGEIVADIEMEDIIRQIL